LKLFLIYLLTGSSKYDFWFNAAQALKTATFLMILTLRNWVCHN